MKSAKFAKILALLLAAVLMMTLMAACGGAPAENAPAGSGADKAPAEAAASP